MIQYRMATKTDREVVYDLYMEPSGNPYLTYDPMSREDFPPLFEKLLATETLYIVEENKAIIGTYRLIPKTDRQAHTVYLGSFTIAKSKQGRGLGLQVINHIMAYLKELGKSRLELTVDVDNAAAIALYKKAGMEIEGRIRNSYRRSDTNQYYDEYLMAVLL